MLIEQQPEFQPITITLETKEEAERFWELLRYCHTKRQGPLKEMANKLSDWFSTEAHL